MKLKSPGLLRELMGPDAANLSLGELAHFAGCSKGFISHLLAGRRSSCTPDLADRIARSLRVPVTVLFDVKVSPTSGATGNQQEAA